MPLIFVGYTLSSCNRAVTMPASLLEINRQFLSVKRCGVFLKLSEAKTKDEMKDHLEFLNNWQ